MMDLAYSAGTAIGTGLPVHQFNKPHKIYNDVMRETLDYMWKKAQQEAWTPSQAKQELFKLAHKARNTIAQTGKIIAK